MTVVGRDYPNFATTNVRAACDRQRRPATTLFYRSQADFIGSDQFDIEVVFRTGDARRTHYTLSVR